MFKKILGVMLAAVMLLSITVYAADSVITNIPVNSFSNLAAAKSAGSDLKDSDLRPVITVDNTYDAGMNLYVLNFYISSMKPLSSGWFGVQFNQNVSCDWNVYDEELGDAGIFHINTSAFTLSNIDTIEEMAEYYDDEKAFLIQYEKNAPEECNRLLLGSVMITEVERDEDGNFIDQDGSAFGDSLFTLLDYGSLGIDEKVWSSDNVWREATTSDRYNEGSSVAGYYQSIIKPDGESWNLVDTAFGYNTMRNEDYIKLKGYVLAYNPNYALTVTAKPDNGTNVVYEANVTNLGYYNKGQVLYRYVIDLPSDGVYYLTYEKPVHVPCRNREVIVESENGVYTIPDALEMFCGLIDINRSVNDSWYNSGVCGIKVHSTGLFHAEDFYGPITASSTEYERQMDLNGDGYVDFFDDAIIEDFANAMSKDYFTKGIFPVVPRRGFTEWWDYTAPNNEYVVEKYKGTTTWYDFIRPRYSDDEIRGIAKLDEWYLRKIGEL